MIALHFTNLHAISKRLKKKPTIKWKGKLMNLMSSVLAVASLREGVPLQTKSSGLQIETGHREPY
jgi:hypothetical protein